MLIAFALNKEVKFSNLYRTFKMAHTSFSSSIKDMRASYRSKSDTFTEDQLVAKEPIAQFKKWFDQACSRSGILEPNAMCLATCTKDGFPSARYVLMKDFGKDGFKFFTNYNSRKGRELIENPNAALVFYWDVFHRSVRIEGVAKKLSEEESREYFQSRGKPSQIGAAISNQSQPIQSRQILLERESFLCDEYNNCEFIPKPEDWGGFIIKPVAIEFWQGQSDRIHDRIRFRIPTKDDVVDGVLLHQGEDGWVYERLQP